jgi:hypothetical protein
MYINGRPLNNNYTGCIVLMPLLSKQIKNAKGIATDNNAFAKRYKKRVWLTKLSIRGEKTKLSNYTVTVKARQRYLEIIRDSWFKRYIHPSCTAEKPFFVYQLKWSYAENQVACCLIRDMWENKGSIAKILEVDKAMPDIPSWHKIMLGWFIHFTYISHSVFASTKHSNGLFKRTPRELIRRLQNHSELASECFAVGRKRYAGKSMQEAYSYLMGEVS